MTVGLRVDGNDPTPPYEQLRRQLANLIETGALTDGTRLPPVRQLAADLGLATGTVARTYRELETAGLVRSRRAAGTTVTAARPGLSSADQRARLEDLVATAVARARHLGASDAEIRAATESALRRPSG
ncbi:GntR family transcriptional regulator [Actinopolymorpha singaporensis]|uniref:DNA-binding transcriptional regulator YhcF, GntR family n=1 Tax=Actinopolymorpha singaporensis TaxID=117157 RepID=A0A1H1RRA7_9ACTN|nr:GntR family transcriptional regulator [Actinopolymorpha singaporensis]SDS38194.1 DNA-binding transcriptional regulator YhcF, GntR family [Actinopolymorpha singaporensis]